MSRTTRQPFILNPINETPEYKLDMTTDRLTFISHVHQFMGTISHQNLQLCFETDLRLAIMHRLWAAVKLS